MQDEQVQLCAEVQDGLLLPLLCAAQGCGGVLALCVVQGWGWGLQGDACITAC